MPRKSPGPKAKGLGAELRVLRKLSKITLEHASASIGLSKQVLSRLETGQRNISADEVAGLLALYGVTGGQRDKLLTMARTLNDPGWWELNMPGMTRESATLADYEDRARKITNWSPLLVPGLLQTPEYAGAFMLDDGVAPNEVESRLAGRLRRQERLTRPDVQYTALIGEAALIGNDEIHRDQLAALATAAERPNVTIRVVPIQAMPRLGRVEAFMVLDVPPTVVVHVEMARSAAFLDDEPFTTPYLRRAARLGEVALSATMSLRRIIALRDEMDV
ncbi:transcriptional regulator with XRE-family HTH domain [Saccharothrix ecbatanensis]|uniref:Transcriptional regulator with XRE-family HTH domain n=1 Tax=Saccharothrix ecbatanensis TaxID=1105145 RepID=A0A7W9HLZ1_9PSEU|nr:helix-turn-helix transcriptional regulator [Saccharothrix ecbatanensis]MBB5804752.1 transcriptional regulator with XRE-family HTH domain [Saccharothrix ecbatanensis]